MPLAVHAQTIDNAQSSDRSAALQKAPDPEAGSIGQRVFSALPGAALPGAAQPVGLRGVLPGGVSAVLRSVPDNYRAAEGSALFAPIAPKSSFPIAAGDSSDSRGSFLAGALAGLYPLKNQSPLYGQGAEGYAKRLASSDRDRAYGDLDQDSRDIRMGEAGQPVPSLLAQTGDLGASNELTPADAQPAGEKAIPPSKVQPKRILGIMPNYRAVTAGAIPPPPTPKEAFVIATQNSFDYSSFIFTGITSAMAEWSNTHPQLGEGMKGYGRYYWRGFLDKTDGNYLVIFALPTVFHQDERYYALGEGGFWKRAIYSASRILITPNYQGHNTFNASEVLGRGIAQGISLSYYPSQDRTAGDLALKYGYALGRDALTNMFREFWPDIATHVLHRHP